MVSPILRRTPDDGKSRNARPEHKPTLTSAHHGIDPVEADALSRLDPVDAALYRTEDFPEDRRAEAEGRPPRYQGK